MSSKFVPQVLVVDFHHARGPEIEFWVTEAGKRLYEHNDWNLLPFLALSDGAHALVEDFAYFTLRNKTIQLPSSPLVPSANWKDGGASQAVVSSQIQDAATSVASSANASGKPPTDTSVFGISCTRQIKSHLLKQKSEDVTRSTVQKAVVVILDAPNSLRGLRERLGAVTSAWFAQQDFTDTQVLKDLQESLERDSHTEKTGHSGDIGLPIREVVYEFRHQMLVLFKALLLQKKMLFFGSKCERLCLLQFALISLIPGLLDNLQDCADPSLDSYAKTITRAASFRSSERSSLLAYMGLPLQLFGQSSFFSPYTPLQLLDVLMDTATHSFVIGSTNSLLLAQKERYCDILINLDEDTEPIQILDPALHSALSLSAADRRWIDHITQGVLDTWDPSNPQRPNNHAYLHSEDAIRLQFEEYLLSLLSSSAYHAHQGSQPFDTSHITSAAGHSYADPIETGNDFNNDFLACWKQTPNYALFTSLVQDATIFDIIEPKHPTAGGLNIEDVQRRLAQGVAELHLDQRMQAGRENLGRAFGQGRERVGQGVARFWKEVDEFQKRREAGRVRNNTEQLEQIDTAYVTASTAQQPEVTAATTPAAGSWTAAIRDRASRLQKPDTAALQTAARDNATRAGQYLSSWGTWARDRGREWSEGRGDGSATKGGGQDSGGEGATGRIKEGGFEGSRASSQTR